MKEIIKLLFKEGIIGTNFKQPITFKSGIKSPVYCDFRKTSAYPDLLLKIMELLTGELRAIGPDCISGVPVGALAYSTTCALALELPHCYVRPEATQKNHGLKKLIEGCDPSGKTIALVEDLFSTGGSAIKIAKILQESGAKKVFLVSIFSYEMERMKKELSDAGFDDVDVTSLITMKDIMPHFEETLSDNDFEVLKDWVRDPEGWFKRHKYEFEFGFLTRLRQTATFTGSIICMGHDPVLEALPEGYPVTIDGYVIFMQDVFAEMSAKHVFPAMLKPNLAWWQCYDYPLEGKYHGSNALAKLIQIMKIYLQGISINIDFKKGDIGTSSTMWALYGYERWLADAVTVHTYMGSDSVGPFIAYCNKQKARGAYLLVKTTNKGADDLQLKLMNTGKYVYEQTAENVISWAKDKPGVGVVAAGNSPEQLNVLGKMFAGKDIPLLIPGVGKSQGGDAAEISKILESTGYEKELARMNLSSGLTHPWYAPGKPNPTANECIDIIIRTIKQLNEQVALA